jgi:hypothetical protein
MSATASIQQDAVTVGDTTTIANPKNIKVDTKAILARLATDKNNGVSFPSGAKLVLLTDGGGIKVVDKTGLELADVSDIMHFELGDEYSHVNSGKENSATGARSTKTMFIGTLNFDDGSIAFSLTGLVTASNSDSAYKTDSLGRTSQTRSISGSMKSGSGTGHDDEGSAGVISGGMSANGKAIIVQQ